MRRISLLIVHLLLMAPALAQEVLPPANARIFANGPQGVALQWPGSPKGRYLVQITTGQVVAVEQEVTGNSISVSLRPGLAYHWKVSAIKNGGFQEIVAPRLFEIVTDTAMAVNGAPGTAGGLGNRRSGYRGLAGGRGGNGLSLTATLEQVGSYVKLSITGAPANRLYYFAPGAGPLILASLGGQGGQGGPGFNGRDAVFNYQTGYVIPPDPGGDGGDGGDGGAGGTITVYSNGLPVEQYLQFDTRGGAGGAPGYGGRGGAGVIVPVDWQRRRRPQGYGYGEVRAPNGQDGVPGANGSDGQVLIR